MTDCKVCGADCGQCGGPITEAKHMTKLVKGEYNGQTFLIGTRADWEDSVHKLGHTRDANGETIAMRTAERQHGRLDYAIVFLEDEGMRLFFHAYGRVRQKTLKVGYEYERAYNKGQSSDDPPND